MPDLQAVTDSSASDISYVESLVKDDSDWFSEVAEDADEFDDDEWFFEDYPLEAIPVPNYPTELYELLTPDFSGEALVATEPAKPGQYAYVKAELYDSGCTQHISPFRDDFENLRDIPPKSFLAANKQSFSATGKGEMVIDVPD
ncbi:hypothetical protein B0H34DRAFT_658121, partial [Crassisporium funariophilum]